MNARELKVRERERKRGRGREGGQQREARKQLLNLRYEGSSIMLGRVLVVVLSLVTPAVVAGYDERYEEHREWV